MIPIITYQLSCEGVLVKHGVRRVKKGLKRGATPPIRGEGGSTYLRKYREKICFIFRQTNSSLECSRLKRP